MKNKSTKISPKNLIVSKLCKIFSDFFPLNIVHIYAHRNVGEIGVTFTDINVEFFTDQICEIIEYQSGKRNAERRPKASNQDRSRVG